MTGVSPICNISNSKENIVLPPLLCRGRCFMCTQVQRPSLETHACSLALLLLPQANSRLHTSAITQWWKGWAVPMPFHSHCERNTYRWDIKEVQLHLHDNRGPRRKINARWSFNMETSPFGATDFMDAIVFLCKLWLSNRHVSFWLHEHITAKF